MGLLQSYSPQPASALALADDFAPFDETILSIPDPPLFRTMLRVSAEAWVLRDGHSGCLRLFPNGLLTMRICLIFTVMLATLMGFAAQAYAGKFVEFESGGVQSNQVRIIGYLARPEGSGPFPAVVVLHGCGGFHQDMLAWADRLRGWGYVAVAVDSFGPRGIEQACVGFGDQPADAFRALAYLKTLAYVRADQVAILGFSMGGISVLAALERGSVSDLYPDKFRAGVALISQM